MTRYAIGDLQGCVEELRTLLSRLKFSADRDRLWFVGDLVNRGPDSLAALRLVRDLGDNAVVVLGNHDLHLLAVACGVQRRRRSDTLDAVLAAPDRDALIEWLRLRPLAHLEGNDLMVHAGVVPQWTAAGTLALAAEVGSALRRDPRALFEHMYGDEPERWDERLAGAERLRFIINVLTRLRLCTADGRVDISVKGPPPPPPSPLRPWFEHPQRASRDVRVIFGHWSALGLVERSGVLGLDSGCVWGGSLTAANLDSDRPLVSVHCREYQSIDAG
ncbi:MAG TPA: symmetrical bis(5'-nucleosyl)-tetraphosphatase [Steroidobacteraceae bacterium]|nr:symmetrical bis(5'-nucleosyl)-tetraphosphatase [Steroidobacteraceae bacterium]